MKDKYTLTCAVRAALPIAIAACGFISVFAQSSMAQGSGDKAVPQSQVEMKNRAPVSKEVLKVNLPKPYEAKLSNGVTVLILENHRLPTATVQFSVNGAGAIYEPADMPGLASMAAQMLSQGTASRSSKQIAEDTDKLGASVSAGALFGSAASQMTASGLSDNLDQWFSLAVDELVHANFPNDELAKLKVRMKTTLKAQRTQPTFLATERFNRAVYGSFPAAIISPTDESIDKITAEDLARWHRERWVPQTTILAITGDVDAKTLTPKLEKWLADWKKTDYAEPSAGSPAPASAKRIYLIDRPNSVQTTIYMGNIALDRRDPDYPVMIVLNQVLGAGPQSRLFINLRENKGYTYGAYSVLTALKYAGPWRAYGDFRTDVTDGSMTELLKEVNRISSEPVAVNELDDAKRAVVSSFALSLENPSQVVGYAITRKIYGFSDDYWDRYPEKIMAVTPADIQRVAKKYFNAETVQIVAVGDASKIKSVMEKYGPVEVYDSTGKPAMAAGAPSNPESH